MLSPCLQATDEPDSPLSLERPDSPLSLGSNSNLRNHGSAAALVNDTNHASVGGGLPASDLPSNEGVLDPELAAASNLNSHKDVDDLSLNPSSGIDDERFNPSISKDHIGKLGRSVA